MSSARSTEFREAPTDWLFAALFLALGILGLRLIHDVDYWARVFGDETAGAKIGDARLIQGGARHKPAGTVAWRDFGRGELRVADGDSIFTGEQGEVSLTLNGSAEARLGPGTLVVVRAPKPEPGSGGWFKSLVSGFVPKRIAVPVKLAVEQGEVRVGERALKKGEELLVSRDEPSVVAAVPVAPAPVAPAPVAVAQPVVAAPVAPAVAIQKKKAEIQVLPSMEVAPVQSTRQERDRRTLTEVYVQLRWQGNRMVSSYQVEVFRPDGSTFESRAVSKPEMTITLKSLEHTKYFYQVTARLKDGREIASDRVPIEIQLPPPGTTSPGDGSQFSASDPTVALAWARTALTDQYRLQISRDSSFRDLVLDRTLTGNVESFEAGGAGRYYWRVRAIVRERTSAWSETRSFSIAAGT